MKPDTKMIRLEWLPGEYAVCRLDPQDEVPSWCAAARGVVSITRTDRELSILAPSECVPAGIQAERGLIACRAVGQLDLSLVGILAKLTGALAEANVSVFAVSTYETDYLFVHKSDRARAREALASWE